MKVLIKYCTLTLIAVSIFIASGCCSRKVSLEEAGKAYQAGDFAKAAAIFAPAAEKGDPEAQVNLAFMYYCGMHVEKNHKLAAEWYLKAAEQNNANAQFSLGTMYENGEGVNRSPEEAYFWYSLAEKQGDKESQRLRREIELKLSKSKVTSLKKRISGWKPAK
ncbi:MAG: tetratricopeptide repeat protein [Candidatus Riflebacteria bacterium]|jgi:TPR repeat protein|nr:tetratricopeptide repeat protein [Candidatus Riflebacteria bacterium]